MSSKSNSIGVMLLSNFSTNSFISLLNFLSIFRTHANISAPFDEKTSKIFFSYTSIASCYYCRFIFQQHYYCFIKSSLEKISSANAGLKIV